MLKGITWVQFGIFIFVATAGYYIYIGLRFYGYLILERLGVGRLGAAGLRAGRIGAGSGGKVSNEAGASDNPDQVELFDQSAKIKEGNELFKMMQQAIGVVRQVITQGAANKLDRENLLDHLHEVLKGYRKLRGTDYAETINNYLVRVCSSELSLSVSKDDLAELWK